MQLRCAAALVGVADHDHQPWWLGEAVAIVYALPLVPNKTVRTASVRESLSLYQILFSCNKLPTLVTQV
jgi:hypothetical protein